MKGFVIHGHAVIGPFGSRGDSCRPANATEAALGVRKTDGSGVDIAGVMFEGMRSEHLLLDRGSNEGAEIASIRLPPIVGLVRESNSRDACAFIHPKRVRLSLRRENE